MSVVALTAAQIGAVDPLKATIRSYTAGSTITKGQAVAIATDKFVDPADASTGGGLLIQFRGIALNGAAAGEPVDVLHDGEMYGFTVSGLTAGDILYLSNTAGGLDTGAGDVNVKCGVVVALNDAPTYTLVVRFFTTWSTVWA